MIIDKLYKETQADGSTKFFTLRKKFLGKIMDFETKAEQKFEKRHLRAYLKSHDYFTFEGMKFKTQYGVSVIPLTEEEANSQKKHIIDILELEKNKQSNASKDKVYA